MLWCCIMEKSLFLHLTHTDIRSDSRVLKELEAISSEFQHNSILGVGVIDQREEHKGDIDLSVNIKLVRLLSRKLRFLPGVIRHTLTLLELTVKMVYVGLKNKPKIIHCHDTLVLPVGVMIKLFSGAKLIYDAHELESDRNGLTPFLGKATLFVEKKLWRFVDALIVVSPSIKQWYTSNVGPKNITVILNSPEFMADQVESGSCYLHRKFNIPMSEKIFIYIGIVGLGRGVELILESFARADVSSHVVFLGYGDLVDEVKKYSVKCSNIHYHPAVPHKEVVSIAQSASVGLCLVENVSLSDYYCLPNKLFEYAFAQIPVLASDFPDIREMVDKYGLGECSGLKASEVFTAIKKIENTKVLSKIDAEELSELSWSAQAGKLVVLYKNLIGYTG